MLRKFKNSRGIGLHLSQHHLSLSIIELRKNGLELVDYRCLHRTGLSINHTLDKNIELLGEKLAELAREMNCAGGRVISAVAGSQVYLRNIVLPKMKPKELREAVFFEASVLLPIPVEEAAMDIFPIREFTDTTGMKVELFFAAARRQAVAELCRLCQIAGLKLAVVELDTIAIYRLIADRDFKDPRGFLYIGDRYSIFFVFENGVPIFQRYFSFGVSSSKHEGPSELLVATKDPVSEPKNGSSFSRLINETSISLEYFKMQCAGKDVKSVIICGNGTLVSGLDAALNRALEHEFVVRTAPLDLSIHIGQRKDERWRLDGEFLISLGLAARELTR